MLRQHAWLIHTSLRRSLRADVQDLPASRVSQVKEDEALLIAVDAAESALHIVVLHLQGHSSDEPVLASSSCSERVFYLASHGGHTLYREPASRGIEPTVPPPNLLPNVVMIAQGTLASWPAHRDILACVGARNHSCALSYAKGLED